MSFLLVLSNSCKRKVVNQNKARLAVKGQALEEM